MLRTPSDRRRRDAVQGSFGPDRRTAPGRRKTARNSREKTPPGEYIRRGPSGRLRGYFSGLSCLLNFSLYFYKKTLYNAKRRNYNTGSILKIENHNTGWGEIPPRDGGQEDGDVLKKQLRVELVLTAELSHNSDRGRLKISGPITTPKVPDLRRLQALKSWSIGTKQGTKKGR